MAEEVLTGQGLRILPLPVTATGTVLATSICFIITD